MQKSGCSETLNFSIDSIQGVDDFDGANLSFNISSDPTSKQASGGYVISYNGNDLINANYYTDNNDIYVAVSNLFDGYLTIPCEGGLTALAESYLGEVLELSDSGISGDIIPFSDDSEDEADDSAAVNGDVVKAVENIWDNTTFEKEGKTKIDVNGETVSAREYTVTIGEEDLENAVMDIYEAAMTEYQASGSEYDSDDMESTLEQVKQMIPSVITGDFVLSVYIADDKVVKLSSDADTNIMGVKLSYDFYLDVNDDLSGAFEVSVMGESIGISCDIDNFKTSPNGEIKLYAEDEEIVLSIESDNSSSASGKTVKGSITCTYDDEDIFKASVDWFSDRDAKTFGGTLGVYGDDDDEAVELVIDGQFVDIVKGQGYGIELNKLALSVEGSELLSMSMKVSLDATTPQIEGIDTSLPVYDITAMTESDLEDIFSANSDKYESWQQLMEDSGITELFGTGSSSATAYIDDDYDDDYDYDDEDYDDDDYEEDDDEMTNVLTSYDDSFSVTILGTIDALEMSYGCEYFVDFGEDDLMVEYMLEEDTTVDDLINNYSYYDEDAIEESEENLSLTISDGTQITYSRILIDFYGTSCVRYYFVRDLGDGYFLTSNVYDYSNTITAEDAAETLTEQYFKVN
jgi:hypothetical protein